MKKLALCIGINDYPGTDNDLQMCVNDMTTMANLLGGDGFEVRMLRDRFGTIKNIKDQLNYLVETAVKGDSIFISDSMHGTQAPDENGDEGDKMDEAICPYDIFTNGPLLDDEIWQIFKKKRPGVQAIWFADSCHSESVVRAFEMPSKGKKRFMHHRHWLKGKLFHREIEPVDLPDDKSLWPVGNWSGCKANEYCYDAPALGNGAFTFYALKALKTIGTSATYKEWFEATNKFLPSRDYPQTPTWTGSFITKRVLS